jgi:hypothetical protein
MGGLLNGKNVKWAIVNDVASSIAITTGPGRTESVTMSPSIANVALDSETSKSEDVLERILDSAGRCRGGNPLGSDLDQGTESIR